MGDEFSLLEQMNDVTTVRLATLSQTIEAKLFHATESLKDAYQSFNDVKQFVPELEEDIVVLERATEELEQYLQRIEAYVKSGSKKSRFW